MIFRIASLLTVVAFFELLSLSVKISYVSKYYTHYISTKVWDTFNGNEYQEFDFIIVGAGSAGCVIANRLSKHNKVLLLEAGGTPYYANSIPVMAGQLLHRPETDYMYRTVPQTEASLGTYENRSLWPRGKLLGGSSNLNYMMYVRGDTYDYDNWANLTKDDSWSYKNLLKYFKKSINYNGKYKDNDANYGYLYGTQSVENQGDSAFYKTLMDSGKELGFKVDIDLNQPHHSGFGPVELNQRKGRRETSYTAFIEPILNNKNLVISQYSQAVKIKLDKSNRAVGIWYIQHGKKKFASVRKEVIVSAGSVDSPKLLMLSGIGPKDHLTDVGIKTKINLPVGQNLKDHLLALLTPITVNSTEHSLRFDRDVGVFDIINYYLTGTGALRSIFGNQGQFYFTSSLTKKATGLDWTDFQCLVSSQGPFEGIAEMYRDVFGLRQEILDQLFKTVVEENREGFMVALFLGRPKSTGSITLESRDPLKHPIIDPKYLSHPDDIVRYVEAMKFVINLFETTNAFKKVNASYPYIPIKECGEHKFRSDQYWECYLRHNTLTVYHPVSTCKMGSGPKDKTSVVDSKLRVLHAKNLRIADASVMPELINANTNAPTVLIGERGADIIRDFWSQQYLICPKLELLSVYLSLGPKCYYSRLV